MRCGLDWSHGALQVAQFWWPLRDPERDPEAAALLARYGQVLDGAEHLRKQGRLELAERADVNAERLANQLNDPAKPATVMIRQPGGAYAQLPELTLATIAAWLYKTPHAPQTEGQLERHLHSAQSERCREIQAALIRDRRPRNGAHPTATIEDKEATAMRQLLTTLLVEGLQQRIGEQLVGPEHALYLHLIARGHNAPGIRVCETCQLVFRATRARQCRRCRKSPSRPRPKPWHHAVYLPDRRLGGRVESRRMVATGTEVVVSLRRGRGPEKMIYEGRCITCGTKFQAADARRRYCFPCRPR